MGLLHIYILYQLLNEFNESIHEVGALLAVFSWIIIPLGLSARFLIKKPWLADAVTWVGMLDMGLFSSLLILTFIRQIILLVYGFANPITIDIFQISALIVLALAFIITVIGFRNARGLPKVHEISIPITNLPSELNGFTIAQISDIHVGPTIKYKYLQSIVGVVNSLNPDMVAITGDLVDGSVTNLSKHTAALTNLISKHGSFFVLGNHEFYSGADEWITEIKSLGIEVLLNQHKVIIHNGASLVIAGVTDYSGERFGTEHVSDAGQALIGAPQDIIKILLAHQPRSAIAATKHGYSLQLSGHTHGGQFWPWNLFVRFQQPFTSGLHNLEGMWVYINRGTGYWGPPKRFGIASEITLVKLIKNI